MIDLRNSIRGDILRCWGREKLAEILRIFLWVRRGLLSADAVGMEWERGQYETLLLMDGETQVVKITLRPKGKPPSSHKTYFFNERRAPYPSVEKRNINCKKVLDP